MISYGRQSITEEDIQEVVKTLTSDFLTQGPKVKEFEKSISDYCGAKYCVAVANGTAALHLAVVALNIPEGRQGITSTNTFTASATSMVYSGIKPVFADIDPDTFNVTTETLKAKITKDTSLFIPVHFAGQPCNMEEIKKLAVTQNIRIIEDAAHAIGSSYADGDRVGSCRYSDMTIFSFHPVKTITTGEGGAITTNDEDLYKRLLLLRSHGITKDINILEKNPGPWYYEMQSLGFNYRMSDIQAALGVSQMKRLDIFKARRKEIIAKYNDAFKGMRAFKTPVERKGLDSCFHLYIAQIDFEELGTSRSDYMKNLFSHDIGTQVHYIPVHTQPFYKEKYDTENDDCPVAMNYYSHALSFPLYPDMTEKDQNYVIESIMSWHK